MNCSKCNAPIPEGSAFCQNCGAAVSAGTDPNATTVLNQQPAEQPPVYTPPVEQAPQQQAPVYTPPVQQAPQQAPVYNPAAAPVTPAPKKKSKAWIAIPIVLVVIVVVAIIAVVAGGSPKDKVVGEWTASIDFSDYFIGLIEDDSDYDLLSKYIDKEEFDGVLDYEFVFKDDDTVTVTVTQESYNAFVDSYVEMLQTAVIGYVRDVYGEYADDMSDEEILAYFEFDTLADEIKEDDEYSADALNDFADFATFTIDKETITFYESDEAGGYYYDSTYEIKGDTMTISFDEGLFDNDELIPYFQNITLVKD